MATPTTAAAKAAAPTLGVRPGPQADRHTLRLDEQGREVDEFGNVIRRATQAVSTLKVGCSMQTALMGLSQWQAAEADMELAPAGQPKEGGAEGSCCRACQAIK